MKYITQFEYSAPVGSFTYALPSNVVPRKGELVNLSFYGKFRVKEVQWVENINDNETVFKAVLTLKKVRTTVF